MSVLYFGIVFLNAVLMTVDCKQQVAEDPSLYTDDVDCTAVERNRLSVEPRPLRMDFVMRCLDKLFKLSSTNVTGSKRSLAVDALFNDLNKLVASKKLFPLAVNSTIIKLPASVSQLNNDVASASYIAGSDKAKSSANPFETEQSEKVKIAQSNDVTRGNVAANVQSPMAPLTIEGLAPHQIPPGNLKVSFPMQILQYFSKLVGQTKNGKPVEATVVSSGGKFRIIRILLLLLLLWLLLLLLLLLLSLLLLLVLLLLLLL